MMTHVRAIWYQCSNRALLQHRASNVAPLTRPAPATDTAQLSFGVHHAVRYWNRSEGIKESTAPCFRALGGFGAGE